MKSNRRSVLIGLGALTVGGGAVFGTGAFSSVEADRTVNVSTTGDAEALFQLQIVSGSLEDGDDGQSGAIIFDQDSLNESALTEFDPGLQVGNTGTNQINVTVEGSDGTASFATGVSDDDADGMYFVDDSAIEEVGGDDTLTLDSDETDVDLAVVFKISDGGSIPDEITFTATDSS